MIINGENINHLIMTLSDADRFFYFASGLLSLVVWLLFSTGSGGFSDFHRRALSCGVCTRPSWLPVGVLAAVLRRRWAYLGLCHATPLAMVLAAATGATERAPVRLALALLLSAYGLVENSVTLSHRDFLASYCAWCLALLDGSRPKYRAAAVLGCCVHFVLSSGVGKLVVAGARGWGLDGDCLGGILRQYGAMPLSEGGPLCR